MIEGDRENKNRDEKLCEFITLNEEFLKDISFLIVLGGDGTLLRASRKSIKYDIPILGVNLGRLGFLSEIDVDDIEEAIDKIIKKDYLIEERMMIKSSLFEGEELINTSVALNDVVFNKFNLSRISNFITRVNKKDIAVYPADGLIVSTPTGSTAYSLSAGGPIVSPNSEVFIITPICAHTLFSRPLIINDNSLIEITLPPPENNILLTYDGQENYRISHNNRIVLSKCEKKVKVIRFEEFKFFEILREKLKWGSKN